MYHLLLRVTEKHIKPGGQNKMKVSFVTKVMSSTVTAAINTLVTVGKDNCTVSLNDTGLSVVMLCSTTVCVHFFFYRTLS